MGSLSKKLKKRTTLQKEAVREKLRTACPRCGQITAEVTLVAGMVSAYCPNCHRHFNGKLERISESMRVKMQRKLKDVPGGAQGKCTNTIIKWHNWEDGENDGKGDNAES